MMIHLSIADSRTLLTEPKSGLLPLIDLGQVSYSVTRAFREQEHLIAWLVLKLESRSTSA